MNLLVSLSLSEIGRAGDAWRRRYGNRQQLSLGFKGLFGRLSVAVIFLLICTVSLFASLKGNNSSLNRPQVGFSYFVPLRVVFLILSVQFLHLNAMFTLMSEIRTWVFELGRRASLNFCSNLEVASLYSLVITSRNTSIVTYVFKLLGWQSILDKE